MTSKTRSNETMEVLKSTGAPANPCSAAVQGAEIRAKGHDGANAETAQDHVVAADAVDERRAHRADDAQHRKQGCPQHRALHADIPHARGALAESLLFLGRAPKQLDEQRAADVQRFVHVRVHLPR